MEIPLQTFERKLVEAKIEALQQVAKLLENEIDLHDQKMNEKNPKGVEELNYALGVRLGLSKQLNVILRQIKERMVK
jgi:hypothetical protein